MGFRLPSTEAERNKFLDRKTFMFTRILYKYLVRYDQQMAKRAKAIIKDCAERSKRGEPGYMFQRWQGSTRGQPEFGILREQLRSRLKELVGNRHWKKINQYLEWFIQQMREKYLSGEQRE